MDDRLRRAERAATDLDGRARLLVERVRAGARPAARLELAAFLGHRGALAADPIERPSSVHSRVEWIADLHPFGHEAPLRAGLAAMVRGFTPDRLAPSYLAGLLFHLLVIAGVVHHWSFIQRWAGTDLHAEPELAPVPAVEPTL